MKRTGLNRYVIALLCTLFFGTLSSFAQFLQIGEEFLPVESELYLYYPEEDGELKAEVLNGSVLFQWNPLIYHYTDFEKGIAVTPNDGYTPTSATWNVRGGEWYCFFYNPTSAMPSFIFTFEAKELEEETIPTLPLEQEIAGDDTVYEITVEVPETLYIITQTGANYSYPYMGGLVFSDPKHTGSSMVQINAVDNGNGWTYSVNLRPGDKYYLWARVDCVCTFDENYGNEGGDNLEAVELPVGTAFTPIANAYYFTPDQNGVLQITYTSCPYDNLLYTSYVGGAFSENVAIYEWEQGSNVYSWYVEAGNTYYLDTRYVKNMEVKAVFPYVAGEDPGTGDEDNDKVIVDLTPADGAEIAGLLEGDWVKVKFNSSLENIVTVTLRVENSDGKFVYQNDLTYNAETGYYEKEIGIDYPFYEGLAYYATFSLYNHQMKSPATLIATADVTWYGTSEQPSSTTQFTGTVPATDQVLEVAADGSVSFEAYFDAPVTVNNVYCPAGQGATEKVSYTADGSKVSVTVDQYNVNQCLTLYGVVRVVIEATGEDGRPVYTRTVTESGEIVNRPFVQIDFQTDKKVSAEVGFDVYTLDGDLLDGTNVAAPFSAVKLSSTESSLTINPSNVGNITVSDLAGNVVARGDYASFEPGLNPTLSFSNEITAAGAYTLYFPIGAFVFGDGMTAKSSAEQTVNFTVLGDETYMDEATVLTPEGKYVTTVATITLSYGGGSLELVSPSAGENSVGFPYSTVPATLTDPDGQSYEVYPYVQTILEGGNDPGIGDWWALSDEPEMETEDILIFDTADALGWYPVPGVYKLVIPAGIVKNANGDVNPAQTLEFNLMRTTDMAEVTPPDYDWDNWIAIEYTANELSAVKLNWEGSHVSKVEGSAEITYSVNSWFGGGASTPLVWGKEVSINAEGNALVIDLSGLKPGEWAVSIPEGYVIVGGTKLNTEQTLTFTIVEGQSDAPIMEVAATVYDPVQQMLGSLMMVTVTWDEAEISVVDGAKAQWYVNSDLTSRDDGELQDGELELVVTTLASGEDGGIATAAEEVTGNALVIYMPFEAFFTKGIFTIVLPQGSVKNALGEVNAEQKFTFWVLNVAEEGAVLVSPNQGNQTELKTIELKFAGATNVSPNEPMEVRLNQTVISEAPYMDYVYDDSNGAITGYSFDVSSLTLEDGTYELIIPEASFLIEDENGQYTVNPEGYVEYIVTGITGISKVVEAVDGKYTVYTIGGVMVLDTEDAADLNGLAKGLYIINGKKVLVK